MGDENVNYQAVLADMRAKRARLDAAIRAMEEMVTGAGAAGDLGGVEVEVKPLETVVSDDTFLGLSITAASEKYLRIAKRPQTTQEIAEALQKGGVHSTSGNFVNTVYTGLTRNEKVVRLGRGKWSLKEWHPGIRSGKKSGEAEATGGDSES